MEEATELLSPAGRLVATNVSDLEQKKGAVLNERRTALNVF
ncbi:MAG: hypothetical protein ACRDBO_18950 [Lachnospiraceae bacterium]